MKVDIYRREESDYMFSYLIVPQGQDIPAEADNVDWHVRHLAIDVDESQEHLHPYEIDHPRAQISEKGYAITSVYHQVPAQAAP